ncbi:glycoside hydrolase family 125 protein [Didymella exigua CBS 183.55]|uniref:Conserved oligomeric Golgi complex subunit 4 n=1 Tax=Didymella exigua CBS 183.55 TaxID=1150837 RepID=A0A6A5S386_9PLEO|nr:glycoside hydrolase family 125 protein [Didymella exigua CBS 183.55]KAF1931947.1 glycoside hydrolase family 125 protein [Didymella exigua CBS 183.55]
MPADTYAAPPSIRAAPPSIRAAPPSIHAAPPSIHAAPPSTDAAPPSIHAAASLADIHAGLAQLHHREAAVTQRLNALVASQQDLSRELARLDLLRAHLGTQAVAARAISNGMLGDAASTATRISRAVNRLDREQANVKATLHLVEQVADLKACVLGVHGSMGAPQDWETAAAYLHRAASIPPDVVDGAFAEHIVPTADVPDPPRATLDAAAASLCTLFLREFDRAAQAGDGPNVTRFFKLFPLVGRADTGLDAYGRYVCTGVAQRARSNFHSAAPAQRAEGPFYANVLTKLFEHIAQIVDGHEPLVEQHYGPGMMAKVIERLQVEADVQGGIVLDTWHEERNIDRTLTQVKSYPFSFLVQSYLHAQQPSTATPRSGSPAGLVARASEDEGVDIKDVDGLLGESALMLARYALYSRFIADKCASSQPKDRVDHGLAMPRFLADSNLQSKISSHLVQPFNAMTIFFFRRSVEKAFQLDESPPDLTLNPNKPLGSSPPFVTSAVDDVMYIVNQVCQRSLATSQRAVVAEVVPGVSSVLGTDFIGMTQRKMRDESYPKPVRAGELPPETKVIAFTILINNLDTANDYIKRIVEQQLGRQNPETAKSPLQDLFPFGHDCVFVETKLKGLESAFVSKSTELLNDGITVLFANVLKPRIRPILAEAFRDIDYAPPEDGNEIVDDGDDGGGDGEDGDADLVKSRFDRGWGVVIRPLKRILTAANFDRLLAQALSYLATALEKRIKQYYGRVNELGAVRLERDISGIVTAAVAGGKYGLRDAFTKCTQMTLIMNMEDDEWNEVAHEESGDGIPWVMSAEERQRIRAIHYSNQKHEPFSAGIHNLSFARPIRSCRTFISQDVESEIERMRTVITDPDLFRLFENTWPSTLDTTIAWRGWSNATTEETVLGTEKEGPQELTFVITGDIYAILLKPDAGFNSLAGLFRGAINLQARYILESPFCNAFQAPDESGVLRTSSMNSDRITPPFDYFKVFSCQWELDSVASFLQLSNDYAAATGDYDFFQNGNWTRAVDTILQTAESMTMDSYDDLGNWQRTPYTYCAPYGGTPINDCAGSPHKGNIGLIRSYHRPSDDSCTYQYLIPSNMMFSAALNSSSHIMARIAPLSDNLNLTAWMRRMSTSIRSGIETHGIVHDAQFGRIYAYEVDGYGSANVMDDPNVPSLLSAPFLAYVPRDDAVYANTRRKILSRSNPYYAWGPVLTGIGSPHTLPGKPWPMANIMAILTSDDDAEIVQNLRMLVRSTDGYGLMHESVSAQAQDVWSRQWFSWANGLFGQAVLDLEKRKPWLLKQSYQ